MTRMDDNSSFYIADEQEVKEHHAKHQSERLQRKIGISKSYLYKYYIISLEEKIINRSQNVFENQPVNTKIASSNISHILPTPKDDKVNLVTAKKQRPCYQWQELLLPFKHYEI